MNKDQFPSFQYAGKFLKDFCITKGFLFSLKTVLYLKINQDLNQETPSSTSFCQLLMKFMNHLMMGGT